MFKKLQTKKNFQKFSLFTLCFTLLTIFWGAWVRFSLSGDACGDHWPLCNKKFLPDNLSSLIEWIHRCTSGLSIIIIIILFILALKIYPKKHLLRKFSLASLISIFIETLIGAILVLGQFVGLNTSGTRVVILAFHLINSLFLIGALSLCYRGSFWNHFKIKQAHIYFLLGFFIIALTGNIASLAGQLFPTQSLTEALALDLLPSAHISLKLRPLHPLIASLFFITLSLSALNFKSLKWLSLASFGVVLFGFATLISSSPIGMKLGHLILAYAFWIFLVFSSVKEINDK